MTANSPLLLNPNPMSAAPKIHNMYPVSNETIPGGYYIIARKIDESEIAHTPPHIREIWLWLIKNVYLTDRIICGRQMRRGQLFTSYKDIQDGLHWMVGYRKETYSKSQCETAMKWLTKHEMITTTKTTRGLIITVCKYDTYQNPKNYENRTESHNRTTTEPQSSDTIYEEREEVKKGRRKAAPFVPPTVEEVKEYFKEHGYREDVAVRAYGTYAPADWHDTKGNKILNWKSKMNAVWFRDEHKATATGTAYKNKNFFI